MENLIEIPAPETGCKSPKGEYVPDCYTNCPEPEIEMDFDADLKRWELQTGHYIADFSAADQDKPRKGLGPTVYVGFDSEFVPGDEERNNEIGRAHV